MILNFEPEPCDDLCRPSNVEQAFAEKMNMDADVVHKFNDLYLGFMSEFLSSGQW